MEHLSAILQAEADRLGLGQSEIARRATAAGHPIRQSHVQAILTGGTADPRLSTLVAVLVGLGRSLAWLDRAEKKNQNSG